MPKIDFTRGALWVCKLTLILLAPCTRASAVSNTVTYYKDVEPIIRKNCAECHRPEQSGPFSLLSYADAARRSRQIAEVTTNRFMPPWSADPGGVALRNSRRLTDAQITVLRRWAQSGAVGGTRTRAAKPPEAPREWPGGVPDMVVRLAVPFSISPDGPDVYHRFVIPLHLSGNRWLRMAEFHPETPGVSRMAMLSLDDTGLARKMAARFDGFGYSSMVGQVLPTQDCFGEWAPGSQPFHLPQGVGILVKQGADLVVLTRLHPIGKPAAAQFRIGLYFDPHSRARALTTVVLGQNELYIRPGDVKRVVTSTLTLPVDVEAYSVLAHAHTLCLTVDAIAVLPNGVHLTLLKISNWNSTWQLPYTFAQPVELPAGTRLTARFTYSNTAPPPPGSLFSAAMVGEMAYLELQTAPRHSSDVDKLHEAVVQSQRMSGR